MSDPQAPLVDLKPDHDFFVGIDSDGCAFDSMEIKHKECFIPNIIAHWNLQAVSKYARMAGEFVNLYSIWRGVNRFPGLLKVFDLLADWDEVQERGVRPPDVPSLRKWEAEEPSPGNPSLAKAVKATGDPILQQALDWSQAVNDTIADMVHGVPPFPHVRESLDKVSRSADIVVVSATPNDALEREWAEHSIDTYVKVIAGQERGKKAEHLALATKGKYAEHHVLMVGDALGDMRAARANNALFYPINPGNEAESWKRFHDEAFGKFLSESYEGDYESERIAEFKRYLPDTPPWKV